METISFLNINVSGFPFEKITLLEISHYPNEHAYAKIVGELNPESAQDCIQRTDETTLVKITTDAEDQPKTLFYGSVQSVSLTQELSYSIATLELTSTSCLIDAQKKNKSYQNTTMTYGQILSSTIGSVGDLQIMVSDKAIGALVMQFNETDWAFTQRMASQLKAPVIASIIAPRPQVYVGIPAASKSFIADEVSFSYGSDQSSYLSKSSNGSSGSMREDFSAQSIKSYTYGYIGDRIVFNGNSSIIKTVQAALVDGLLQMNYGLLSENSVKNPDGLAGIAVPSTPNAQASGKMMMGKVQAVANDKVQLHLIDVDGGGYDSGGTWWFPYSTAYSSSDGSGWYCMPEVGDMVRVFFPSGNEGEAFAASSVCASPPSNTRDKSWKAPGGKQILLTDQGMFIICSDGKIFINLTDDKGIEIHASNDINISSETKVYISAGNDVRIVAENEIIIGTETSYLNITKESASLMADSIIIN